MQLQNKNRVQEKDTTTDIFIGTATCCYMQGLPKEKECWRECIDAFSDINICMGFESML